MTRADFMKRLRVAWPTAVPPSTTSHRYTPTSTTLGRGRTRRGAEALGDRPPGPRDARRRGMRKWEEQKNPSAAAAAVFRSGLGLDYWCCCDLWG